ncbi:MAG: hypothetical protein ACTSQL_12845 [Promethearchaeota archaeon]
MSKRKRIKKALVYVLSISLVIIFLVTFGPFVVWRLIGIPDYIKNNDQLEDFAQNITDYPLPQDTEFIDVSKRVALTGNGNHCDFVVELILKTSLSESEIRNYYSSVEFPPVRSEYQGFQDSYSSGFHEPIKPWLDINEEAYDDKSIIVTLQVLDFGYPPGLDYRCH